MVKKIAIIRPTRIRSPDGSMDTYSYPDYGKLKVTHICYNRFDNPPNGDFLCEGMFIVEGEQSDIDNLLKDIKVTEIDKTTAILKGNLWDPPNRDIESPLLSFGSFTSIKNMLTSSTINIPLDKVNLVTKTRGFVASDWNFD